jgi:hypothetical protein
VNVCLVANLSGKAQVQFMEGKVWLVLFDGRLGGKTRRILLVKGGKKKLKREWALNSLGGGAHRPRSASCLSIMCPRAISAPVPRDQLSLWKWFLLRSLLRQGWKPVVPGPWCGPHTHRDWRLSGMETTCK